MHVEWTGRADEAEGISMGLIEVDDNGKWRLKGVEWKQIAPGAVITKKIWEKLYGALWKLKD